MTTYFKFKNPNYTVSPPQDGAPSITNFTTADSSYKQDVSNIPVSVKTSQSVNLTTIGIIALSDSVGSFTDNDELSALLHSEFGGFSLLDITQSGDINASDALTWVRIAVEVSAGFTINEYSRSRRLIKLLEENYEKFKDYSVTYNGQLYNLYKGPPNASGGFFDPAQHYIVVDYDDPVDRLKLIKYKKLKTLNASYWYDAGTGNENEATQGLIELHGKASKKANTSLITPSKITTFNGSLGTNIDTGNNTISLPNHGYKTGDGVFYEAGEHINFVAGDSSVVNIATNIINYPDHGYLTGDLVKYTVTPGSTPIAPLRDGAIYEIYKHDNDSFKFRNINNSATIIDFTGLGFGVSKVSGVKVKGTDGADSIKQTFYVIATSTNSIQLASSYANATASPAVPVNLTGVGTGQNHKLTANYRHQLDRGDFVGVYETASFVANGTNVNTTINMITLADHGYSTGDTTIYNPGIANQVIGGLTASTLYYVIRVDDNNIKLAANKYTAANNIPISLTTTGSGTQSFDLEFGAKIYKIDERTENIFTNTSDAVVFTNRTLKKSNFSLQNGKDVIVSKVFKYNTQCFVDGAINSSTSLVFDGLSGERPEIGATVSGTGISGTPTITNIVYDSVIDVLGLSGTITLSSAQTLSDDTQIILTSTTHEPYVKLDSGDKVLEDEAPQLGGDLDLNGNSITAGNNSVNSIVTSTNNIANNNNNTSLPTSAAVVSYTDNNYLKSNADDTFTGRLTLNGDVIFDPSLYTRTPPQNQPEPFVGFKLVDQSTSFTGISFYEKVHLGAYGLYLTADNDMSSSKKALITTGGEHQLYIDSAYARTDSGYFLNFTTSSLGLRINGEIYANQDYRAGFFKSFRPNVNYQAYLGESSYRFQSLFASYGYFTGLDVTSYMRLSDSDNLYWGTSYDTRMFYDGSANTLNLRLNTQVNSFNINENSTTRFTFAPDTGVFTCTSVTESSDERLKSNIKTLEGKKVLQMRGVTFERDNGTHSSGVIAQEIEKIAPEIVSEDDKGYKSVAYSQLTGYLIEAVKDQQKQIDELKNLVQSLMEK